MTALGKLGGGKTVYPPGSIGTSSFARVIGPPNANGPSDPLLADFPSFAPYIAKAFNSKGAPVTAINISNSYSGQAAKPDPTKTICTAAAFAQQNYSTTSITYNSSTGALSIEGTGGKVGNFTLTGMVPLNPPPKDCGGSVGPLTCYSAKVTPEALSAAFYTALLSYSVAKTTACAANKVETNGANDVFSVVVRDFLVGFASGFVNSTVPAPPSVSPPTIYGLMKSSQWSTDAAKLFAGVQPANAFYNPWGAAVFNALGNTVYGFQYSDYFIDTGPLGNPLLVLQPGVPVQIVIQNSN